MNSVIALCHFCEVHGPVVVICTQPYTNKFPNARCSIPVYEKSSLEKIETYIHTNKLFHMYDLARQNNLSAVPRQPPCPACTSIGKDDSPLVSNDHSTQVTYMSSQSPEDIALFTLLRHACIRSLTCEITPGEDGAIFFGEESNGHVLSYRFKLQNARARGLLSTYSIVVLSKDKLALLNLWPFLVPNIRVLVTKLQEAAQLVYADEQAVENTRSMRLGNSDLHPAASYRSRTGDMEPRSLLSITRQDKLFYQIHAWFTWLLRVGGRTFSEWNPSINDSGEELSVMAGSVRDGGTGVNGAGQLELELPVRHLSELYRLLGRSQFSTLAFHAVIGNQIIVRSDSAELSTALTAAISLLLPRACASQGYSDTTYLQLFQYNLLALDVNVPLSSEVTSVDAAPCVVLLVTRKRSISTVSASETSSSSQFGLNFDNITIRMDSSKPPVVCSLNSSISISSMPRIVEQYMHFLDNPLKLSWKMVLTNLEIVHNEWLNKSQLYFAFKRKQTTSRLSDAECEERLLVFLKAIGIPTVADCAVVRFWVRGVSDESKKNITSSMHHQSTLSSSSLGMGASAGIAGDTIVS